MKTFLTILLTSPILVVVTLYSIVEFTIMYPKGMVHYRNIGRRNK